MAETLNGEFLEAYTEAPVEDKTKKKYSSKARKDKDK